MAAKKLAAAAVEFDEFRTHRQDDIGGEKAVPSYGDDQGDGKRAGFANEFTNRNSTVITGTCST